MNFNVNIETKVELLKIAQKYSRQGSFESLSSAYFTLIKILNTNQFP